MSLSTSPVLCLVFLKQDLSNYLPGRLETSVLLISASSEARIIDVSHGSNSFLVKDNFYLCGSTGV
jgi:hypothetical protein